MVMRDALYKNGNSRKKEKRKRNIETPPYQYGRVQTDKTATLENKHAISKKVLYCSDKVVSFS